MDADAKKRLLRKVPYGLYAACTRSDRGEQHIFLLSWLTQASFEPPIVACGIHRASRSHANLSSEGTAVLALNLLAIEQQGLATEILKAPSFKADTVAGTPYRPGKNGCALLTETLGALEAEVVDRAEAGDHTVFVCKVTDAHQFRNGEPLTHASTGWKYAG